jgi:hypothetical protein
MMPDSGLKKQTTTMIMAYRTVLFLVHEVSGAAMLTPLVVKGNRIVKVKEVTTTMAGSMLIQQWGQ